MTRKITWCWHPGWPISSRRIRSMPSSLARPHRSPPQPEHVHYPPKQNQSPPQPNVSWQSNEQGSTPAHSALSIWIWISTKVQCCSVISYLVDYPPAPVEPVPPDHRTVWTICPVRLDNPNTLGDSGGRDLPRLWIGPPIRAAVGVRRCWRLGGDHVRFGWNAAVRPGRRRGIQSARTLWDGQTLIRDGIAVVLPWLLLGDGASCAHLGLCHLVRWWRPLALDVRRILCFRFARRRDME
mmetsp:Transcript_17133/g.37899  ORF Transcript_17133/g.37899 Transcript_17133/m.37899 type:complete len:239 (+) Transcript_17133:1312-2028(+)